MQKNISHAYIPAIGFTVVCHANLFSMGAQEKLLNAAKARVRRMVQEKSKRTDLAAPEFIKLEWEKGTAARTQMALCLQEVNWSKEWLKVKIQSNEWVLILEIIVSKSDNFYDHEPW